MITVSRSFEFDYAHRVLGHEGKCKHLHGHRAKAVVTVQAPRLDALGRIIDFGVLKQRVGSWIETIWDHNCLLHQDDPLLLAERECQDNRFLIGRQAAEGIFAGRPPYVMPDCGNPTAENMAKVLFFEAARMLPELQIVSVQIWETPNCVAEYRSDL